MRLPKKKSTFFSKKLPKSTFSSVMLKILESTLDSSFLCLDLKIWDSHWNRQFFCWKIFFRKNFFAEKFFFEKIFFRKNFFAENFFSEIFFSEIFFSKFFFFEIFFFRKILSPSAQKGRFQVKNVKISPTFLCIDS